MDIINYLALNPIKRQLYCQNVHVHNTVFLVFGPIQIPHNRALNHFLFNLPKEYGKTDDLFFFCLFICFCSTENQFMVFRVCNYGGETSIIHYFVFIRHTKKFIFLCVNRNTIHFTQSNIATVHERTRKKNETRTIKQNYLFYYLLDLN